MKYYIESENKFISVKELRSQGYISTGIDLLEQGFFPVKSIYPKEPHNEKEQMYVLKELVRVGNWYHEIYEIQPIDEDELNRRQEAQKQADYLEQVESAKELRDKKLAATDFYLMADYPIASDKLEKIKTYRQALRDLPTQENFPYQITWPELNLD